MYHGCDHKFDGSTSSKDLTTLSRYKDTPFLFRSPFWKLTLKFCRSVFNKFLNQHLQWLLFWSIFWLIILTEFKVPLLFGTFLAFFSAEYDNEPLMGFRFLICLLIFQFGESVSTLLITKGFFSWMNIDFYLTNFPSLKLCHSPGIQYHLYAVSNAVNSAWLGNNTLQSKQSRYMLTIRLSALLKSASDTLIEYLFFAAWCVAKL